MEYFELMNAKLEEGWKMTDGSCAQCNSLVLFNPQNNTYNCIKCRAPVKISGGEHTDPQHQKKEQEYQQDIIRRESQKKIPSRSDEISKLMSTKLLQGWAMLEKTCEDCNVPIMRSKQGDEICCGCQRNYKQKPKQVEAATPTKPEPVNKFDNHPPPVVHKKPAVLPVRSRDREGAGSTSVMQVAGRTLLLAAQFYQERMQQAVARNDQPEVSRILQAVKELVSISSRAESNER